MRGAIAHLEQRIRVLEEDLDRIRSELGDYLSALEARSPIEENDDVSACTRCKKALEIIHNHGDIDGSHHKQWVLDQVVRVLAGDQYGVWVKRYKAGKNGPDTFEWDEGIAP